jgi:hypothetical protein
VLWEKIIPICRGRDAPTTIRRFGPDGRASRAILGISLCVTCIAKAGLCVAERCVCQCIQARANYNMCNENVTDASIKKGSSVAGGGWESETRPVDVGRRDG